MSAKNNVSVDARQELAELVKRKAEIGVRFIYKFVLSKNNQLSDTVKAENLVNTNVI